MYIVSCGIGFDSESKQKYIVAEMMTCSVSLGLIPQQHNSKTAKLALHWGRPEYSALMLITPAVLLNQISYIL